MQKSIKKQGDFKSKDWVIKKSKIHGKGVFAARDFKKGEVVLRWDLSNRIKKKDIIKLPEQIRKNIYYYRGKYIIPTSPGKYFNHSCNANTFAKNACDIARRNIKKGEEITVNYSNETIIDLKMKCKCGSKNCKNMIQGKSLPR